MDKATAEKLIGRDDIVDFKVRSERFALVVVCFGDGSYEKISVAHHPDLDDSVNAALAASGLRHGADVLNASDEELAAIKGIGPKAVKQMREAMK